MSAAVSPLPRWRNIEPDRLRSHMCGYLKVLRALQRWKSLARRRGTARAWPNVCQLKVRVLTCRGCGCGQVFTGGAPCRGGGSLSLFHEIFGVFVPL